MPRKSSFLRWQRTQPRHVRPSPTLTVTLPTSGQVVRLRPVQPATLARALGVSRGDLVRRILALQQGGLAALPDALALSRRLLTLAGLSPATVSELPAEDLLAATAALMRGG